MIKQDSEMAADESAIAILGEEYRTEYGETLLSFISQRSNFSNLMVLSTSMSGKNKTFMKSRIVNIKNGTRRSVATIIIISMVLTMIVGCSLFDTNKVKAASYVDESDVWYEYSLTTYCDDLNDELNADGVYGRAELITTDVRVFSVGANDAYNENYPATTMLASYTPDGDLIGIINIDSSEYYVGSLFECNGEIMGVVNDMMTSDFKLVSLDFNNGEIVNKCNISSICSRNLSFINNVKSNNSLIYIEYSYLTSSESKVGFLIMDMDGNVQVDVESDFKNVNWTIDGSGNIFCVDCDFEESNQTYTYYVIDLSTGEISLNPANINPEYNFFLSGDYLYLINLDGSIDRYSFITGEIEEIYNSNCSFFNSNEFSCFIMAYCDTDTMIFIRMGGSITRNLDLCGKQILTLTRADSNPNARKQILTAAVLSYADGYAISSFNENNDSYMIQIDNRYNIWNDYMSSDYYTRLSNLIDCIESDIEAGIGPDLIFGNVTDEKLFSADYVMDLNSFVDGTNGLNREEYYTNIIECASKEDKLYQMPVYYSLSGILVDPSLIDESSYGFTYSEYYEFGEEYGYSTIFDTKINAFENLYSFSDQDFCDENGAFDVNNDDFRDLIIVSEACESGRHNNDSAYVIYIMNMIHFLSYQMYSRYTDWQLLGMPSRYGNGPSINIANSIAITKCSSDSEAAWEFIKYELSEEVQSDCEYLPVNKIAFMNSANAAVAYANEYIYYTRGKTDYYSYDFVEIMNAWVLRSNEVVYMNNNLKYDVCQVVNDYFHGAYDSIDEVIAVIEG